jgi:uncharacterized protein (DUF305 family)
MLSHQIKSCIRTVLLALATALVLASCAGSGGGSQGNANEQQKETGGMADHGHGHMHHGSENGASGMLMENGRYSDERFIDAMVTHHQGAVEMAQVALEKAEHDEIVQLSENIISTQQAEIEELKSIKRDEFDTSRVPMEMSPKQMESMGTMTGPQELADKEPFDKAFIDAMIPHHQSAIEMAQVAREKSDVPEITELTGNIISAQQAEIEQMEQWRREWYPQD